MSIFTKADIKKARKKVLSFVTAFAITGTMLSYAPVIKENMGYDVSEYSASAEGASSENTGGTGSTSSSTTFSSNGQGSNGQGRMGLLVYPVILSDSNGGIEPADFNSLNRWGYVQEYGTYVEVDSSGNIITSYGDTVKDIDLTCTGNTISMSSTAYIGDDNNAFANAIKNTLTKTGFHCENYADLSSQLNSEVAKNKKEFHQAWKATVKPSTSMVKVFENAIADDRFMWCVEILGELTDASGARYMVTLSDMCTLRWLKAPVQNVNYLKAMDIANNIGSFCPNGEQDILWGATAYLNINDKSNYGALGCLRPNVSNGKWNGKGNGFGGWGIITISADEAGIADTNYQVIETATLIAGKDTGYATTDRDAIISCSNYLETGSYAQNGVVANFVNRVSSVWVLNKSSNFYEVAFVNNEKDTYSMSVYPNSMIASTPLSNVNFILDKTQIRYKAVLSDGSAETGWVELSTNEKQVTSNTNEKRTVNCLAVNTKNENLKVKGGTYAGKTIQEAARSADKDIFFIVNAPYVYEGLDDSNFKTFNVSQNKLTSRSESLLNFISDSTKNSGKLWVNNEHTVGSLYGQISDVGLPKFTDFFKSSAGLNNGSASSKNKTTYFIKATTDNEGENKATNVNTYYYEFKNNKKLGALTSSLIMYPNIGESTDTNSFKRGQELSTNYPAPLYSDHDKTTRYRYEETGTDGSGVVSRAYIGDVVNIAKFSRFNNVANGVNLNTSTLATLGGYGFVSGYVPGTRFKGTKDAGFVRATSNTYTGDANQRSGLTFDKFCLNQATLNANGKVYSCKEEDSINFSQAYISSVLRKASVDTKIKLKDDVYGATSVTWTPNGKSEVDTGFSVTTSKTLKFYPEVKMQYDTNNSTNNNVYVVGDEEKVITPIVYSNLSIESGEVKVDSSAIAVDSRAKQLAKDLGFKDVPVYLTGGVITGSTKGDKLSVSSYIVDISDTEAKKAWGNTDYDAASLVKDALSTNIKKVSVTPTVLVDDGKDSSYKLGDKAEAEIKEVGTPELAGRYLLEFESGKITSVYYWKSGETTANELELDSDEVKQVLAGTQVETALKSVMENNGGNDGWYNEDTSVICINKYTTEISLPGVAFSDKLPLDAGPKSAETKDKQFNKGYKAYVSKEIEVLDKDGNKVPVTVSVSGGDTPNFIIPNVSVIDVAQ